MIPEVFTKNYVKYHNPLYVYILGGGETHPTIHGNETFSYSRYNLRARDTPCDKFRSDWSAGPLAALRSRARSDPSPRSESAAARGRALQRRSASELLRQYLTGSACPCSTALAYSGTPQNRSRDIPISNPEVPNLQLQKQFISESLSRWCMLQLKASVELAA